jgi:hypothetical protein
MSTSMSRRELASGIAIQVSKPQAGIVRYELTDHEWSPVTSMLPNTSHDIPRLNDRRVLNGIVRVSRSGVPWRDLPPGFSLTPTAGRI